MSVLHLLFGPDDETREILLAPWRERGESDLEIRLDEEPPDYDRLLDLIFGHDRVVCWR